MRMKLYEADLVGKNSAWLPYFKDGRSSSRTLRRFVKLLTKTCKKYLKEKEMYR